MVDRRADVFSLGVTLYEGLTNTRPFARDSDLAILNAVLKGDFKRPNVVRPDLPSDLEAIVLKAMAHEKEKRYQTAEAFARDLEQFLAASTTSARGTAQVGVYLRSLFGDARVKEKTRIPTLSSLEKSGAAPPGYSSAKLGTGESPRVQPPDDKTGVTGARVAKGHPWRWVAAIGGVSLLLAALVVAGLKWFSLQREVNEEDRPSVLPRPVVSDGTQTLRPAALDAGGGPRAVGQPDSGQPHPVVRPVMLTPQDIQRQVLHQSTEVMRCMKRFSAELPNESGQIVVTFTIEPSGRVSAARTEGPLAETQVGRCVARGASAWMFPRNLNGPLKLQAPVAYHRE
jgi:serine/threonine-protein kinase